MSEGDAVALTVVLDVVVGAARGAGQLIREEFARPDGPRGRIGQCPVDEEAEVLIRRVLRTAYPNWQFFGEETGTTGGPSRYHWLVDPNDGTSAFQRGFRGSAISIALLRASEVVLGVVLAPCPPIGQEDLITWYEGGELERNGAVVERRWSPALGRDDVVLVSQAADIKPTANEALASPARFRSLPSVAYRLAMAAVGEGEAAISVATTSDYDFAGGHALLKGAGGVLVDAAGREPQYAPDGGRAVNDGGVLIGGGAAAVQALSDRDWRSLHTTRREDVPFVFARAAGPGVFGDRLDRAQGLLLGQLIGDALGAQVEFESATAIADRYPDGVTTIDDGGPFNTLAGQPTDDSEMALSLARILVRDERYDVEAAALAYVDWYRSRPFDIGNTTRRACSEGVHAAEKGRPIAEAMTAGADVESQSNGGLMRISPMAVWASDDVAAGVQAAMADARLTHPHPVCVAANAVFVAALVEGLAGGTPASMVDAAVAQARSVDQGEVVQDRLTKARSEAPQLDTDKMGWVLHALQNAFHELQHARTFEEGLVRTVGRGGDTDTNGAITGALLGAAFGAATIPDRWWQSVLTCRPTADRAHNPRPMQFWPVDALLLAERLLQVGPQRTSA